MSLRQRDLPPDQNMFLPFPAVFRSGIREGKKQAGYRDYSCQALTINMNWIGAGSGVTFKQKLFLNSTVLRVERERLNRIRQDTSFTEIKKRCTIMCDGCPEMDSRTIVTIHFMESNHPKEEKMAYEFKNLLVDIADGIAVVTINRPKSLNALNSETLAELDACFAQIEADPEAKVLILTGSGSKSFVAGADISEMVNGTAPEGRTMGLLARVAFKRLEDMEKPTIAAVNGFALGGGCEISMACDVTLASDNAKFGQPEAGLGIIPGFGGTQRLPRLTNKKIAKELIFGADIMISADEAMRIGLVNHVYPQDQLMDEAKKLAGHFMKSSPYSIAIAKQAINVGLDTDLDAGLKLEANMFGLTFATFDKKEGMTAFLEKKKEKHFIGK